MASINWAKTTTRRDEKHLSLGIWCGLYSRFDGVIGHSSSSNISGKVTAWWWYTRNTHNKINMYKCTYRDSGRRLDMLHVWTTMPHYRVLRYIFVRASFNLNDLTYWDMDKMADILRMTTSFSSIGIVLFWIPIPKEWSNNKTFIFQCA